MTEEKKHTFQCFDVPKRCFKYFNALKNKKELCDITLQIGSESVSAHRIIITAVIPYFRGILNSEKDKQDINISNIEPNAIKCLIDFAYTWKVDIDAENVRNLLTAACYLGVDEVRDACCDFLVDSLAHDNALNIRELAGTLHCAELLKCADCYVKRNFQEVALTRNFLQCPSTYLKELIGEDDIEVDNEEKVLEAILRWIKNSPKERIAELPELVRKVRMTLLDPLYLTQIVEREEIIRASGCIIDLIDEARNYVLFPQLRKSTCSFVIESRGSSKSSIIDEPSSQYICSLYAEIKFSAQYFDLVTKNWHTKAKSSFGINGGSSAEVNKKLYFFYRGCGIEYDLAKDEYRNLSPMSKPRIFTTATALKNQIYVCGGKEGAFFFSSAVERFCPEDNQWTSLCSMKISCCGASSVALDDYIFVLGGRDLNSLYDTVQRYDSVLDKWKIMGSLLNKRCFAAAATLNGKIYVCGGNVGGSMAFSTISSTAEVYDPIRNTCTYVPLMTAARRDFSLLSCLGKLYAVGGNGNDGKIKKHIDVYDPENDDWGFAESDEGFKSVAAVVL